MWSRKLNRFSSTSIAEEIGETLNGVVLKPMSLNLVRQRLFSELALEAEEQSRIGAESARREHGSQEQDAHELHDQRARLGVIRWPEHAIIEHLRSCYI